MNKVFAFLLLMALWAVPVSAGGPPADGCPGVKSDGDGGAIIKGRLSVGGADPGECPEGSNCFEGPVIMGTSRSGMEFTTQTGDYTAPNWGIYVFMTAPGDVAVPDCTADTLGQYIIISVRDESDQVSAAVQDTVNDLIVLSDGTELDINDEGDLAATAGSKATLMCKEENKIYVESGAVTDGGAAD